MDVLVFATLVVTGFTACAEFGSWAFVHPVVRRLPTAAHVQVEQGLVRTFGRVMPVLMTGSLVLLIVLALAGAGGVASPLRITTAALWGIGLVTTIVVNVPINLATARWDPDRPAAEWDARRRRWERFQGVRSWLYLVAFVLIAASATTA